MTSGGNDRRLPPGLTAAAFGRALQAFRAAVGAQWVLVADEDRAAYVDPFALDDGSSHSPSAIVAPAGVEEVQAVVRIANEHGVPLWPISRGKNLGYGGPAPRMAGTVTVDLTRMNRILEVDEKYGYCLVEPGVGFFDLHDHLQKNRIPLWMSVPGNAWGSVAGNALERGVGPQPYGDHAAQICGLEVVLPTGSLVRTGTGAMAGSRTWQTARHGYGPGWDPMFCQSNFGIVTKLGLWLMPAPEATMSLMVSFPEAGDLRRGIDTLYPLRRNGVVDHDIAFVSYVGLASYASPRSRWFEGEGVLPEPVGVQIRKDLGLGWWTSFINLYGYEKVIKANAEIVLDTLRGHAPEPLAFATWRTGDPPERSGAGIPGTRDMQMINWRGGRGGHLGFSPLLPADGALAQDQFERARCRYEAHGLDYYGAFAVGRRAIVNVNEILYDRDDRAMTSAVDTLFGELVADAARHGYGEYRTHLDYMDEVAATFDFNDYALLRLNETVKDALDPNGVLAPGKQGIWPRRYRDQRKGVR